MSMTAQYHQISMQHFGGLLSHETVSPEDSDKSLKRDDGLGSTLKAWNEAFYGTALPCPALSDAALPCAALPCPALPACLLIRPPCCNTFVSAAKACHFRSAMAVALAHVHIISTDKTKRTSCICHEPFLGGFQWNGYLCNLT